MTPATLSFKLAAARRASLRTCQPQAPRPLRATRLVCRASVDSAKVLADVRSIIAEQLGTDVEKVKPDSKFTDLGADSLDTVEIMMAMETKFDIELDEDKAENIATVQQAADLICSQIK